MVEKSYKYKDKRRAGRTILVRSGYLGNCDLNGKLTEVDTKTGSKFMIFDNVESAKTAFNILKESGARVKYSYYKLFFKIKNIDSTYTYDKLKELIKNCFEQHIADSNILYLKLYRKNGKLTGSGDLVLDLKSSLDDIVNKRNLLLENDIELSVYRFIIKKKQSNEDSNMEYVNAT